MTVSTASIPVLHSREVAQLYPQVIGLMIIEHHRKNTEDEPRGVVFKHDLIEGHDSERTRLKKDVQQRYAENQNRNIFQNTFLSLK
jgi:hypothetical protein